MGEYRVGPTNSLIYGLMHPVSGIDHVLAMTLVGVVACQIGGRALWLVPAAFVGFMLFGGALGLAGAPVPFIEAGIALSFVVFGAVVAFSIRPLAAVGMALAGLFAIFHGYAHASEVPNDAGGVSYVLGFTIATALLHAAGIGVGALVSPAGGMAGRLAIRAAGGLAAVVGAVLLVQAG